MLFEWSNPEMRYINKAVLLLLLLKLRVKNIIKRLLYL